MGGAALKPLPDGVQRVVAALQVQDHPHAPVADVVQAPVAGTIAPAPELIAARAILARAAAENVPSPCISVCRMNERTGLCEGCYRTLDEIRDWSSADDSAKRTIWRHIEQRLTASPS